MINGKRSHEFGGEQGGLYGRVGKGKVEGISVIIISEKTNVLKNVFKSFWIFCEPLALMSQGVLQHPVSFTVCKLLGPLWDAPPHIFLLFHLSFYPFCLSDRLSPLRINNIQWGLFVWEMLLQVIEYHLEERGPRDVRQAALRGTQR